MTRFGWRPSDADAARPRYGYTPDQWRRIADLHRRVWAGELSDWPDGGEPDPRERDGRLCFQRWRYATGRLTDD